MWIFLTGIYALEFGNATKLLQELRIEDPYLLEEMDVLSNMLSIINALESLSEPVEQVKSSSEQGMADEAGASS